MAVKPLHVCATGRRKTSSAKVFARPAEDKGATITVNGCELSRYFREPQVVEVMKPFKVANCGSSYAITATISGGGYSGQAGALRLGIARVLEKLNPSLRSVLKKDGLLSRDARKVERKKPGRHKARKRPQFSKR